MQKVLWMLTPDGTDGYAVRAREAVLVRGRRRRPGRVVRAGLLITVVNIPNYKTS